MGKIRLTSKEKRERRKAYRLKRKLMGFESQTSKYRRVKPEWYLWYRTKVRAKKEGLDFNLKVSDIVIPEYCPVLGIKIILLKDWDKRDKRNANGPSVDRIENDKGYVVGNIAVISWRANNLKGALSLSEAKAIYEYMNKHINART